MLIHFIGLLTFGTSCLAAVIPLGILRPCRISQASLPRDDCNATARAAAILVKRQGYLYGMSLIGNASFFPKGPLANDMVQDDMKNFNIDGSAINDGLLEDLRSAAVAVENNGGLSTLDDYSGVLYDGQWNNSVPGGQFPGMLTNYTHDLLFSMERLSLNPFKLKRLKPSDKTPFTVRDSIVRKVAAGYTFKRLLLSGNLFVADHSYQAQYPKTDRYGAACTALFYIHPISRDFLPLAIKTNVGTNLVYTPLDRSKDWLLAKIMFNMNDIMFAQMWHLVATHDVGEIVHEAALRTLSDTHPIMIILDRLMYQAYALRPIGQKILFNYGGAVDLFFHIKAQGAFDFVTEHYPTAGSFQGNYLETNLRARGLLDPPAGFRFKTFPFYSDASLLRNKIRKFMTSFVNTYYPTPRAITQDYELQAWFIEATDAANVLNFPMTPSKNTLIQALTHFAYLTGIAHHALNTGNPVASIGTLPFHPTALYSPVPTTKGVTDIVPFLPPTTKALGQVYLFASFNRPNLAATNRTLVHAFSDPVMLSVLDSEVATAASDFKTAMERFSAQVRARTFDDDGLSQGMPFIYKALDPGAIPFYFAV